MTTAAGVFLILFGLWIIAVEIRLRDLRRRK
jgi:hypothetical protein